MPVEKTIVQNGSTGTSSTSTSAVAPCPVEEAIRVIGGKWKLLILRSLLLNGPQRYNELLSSVTGISAKELTRNLSELSSAGLIAQATPIQPQGVPYSLSSLGEGLMPTFASLLEWGKRLQDAR